MSERLVCTAFHVVGSCGAAKWAHELDPGRSYWLEGGGGPIRLSAAAFDARADVALLSREPVPDERLALADFSRTGVAWKAVGFPGFHEKQPFTLSGNIVTVAGHETARAVQLLLDQKADVAWEGVSGSAVVENSRVLAVITNVTQATSTAWAAPVTVVRRLLQLLEIQEEVRRLPEKYSDLEVASTKERLAGADHARTAALLEAFHRSHPEAAEAEPLKSKLAKAGEQQPYLGMPATHLASLQSRYELVAERDGATRFRTNPTGEFREIFLANRNFGGRREELTRLDKFQAVEESGYMFVTGLSGYGKTSLLATWIETLHRSGELACFHFFNGRIPESLDPKTAFTKLCKQLLALHRVGGGLPVELADLQSLYAELISQPSPEQRSLVIVIDGLDEVLNTLRPGPALFPTPLGKGVHVVFSARAIGKDWLGDFGLSLDKDHAITLGQLGRSDIAEVLAHAGLPAGDAVLDKLTDQTRGDPFYVADIVRSLMGAGGDLAVLDDLPADHSNYLEEWWNDAMGRVTRPGLVDLMGTLAALHAPLSRNELLAISRDDELKPGTIDLLLKDAARYVERDEQGRYWLTHDRIRQFVRSRLADDMDIYHQRLIAFARHWNDTKYSTEARKYGRNHAVAHLLERDAFAEALGFLDAEVMAGKWREEGSYRSLLSDIDRMLAWISAHPKEREAVCAASALAIGSASVRDLMRKLPEDWYRAQLRLGGYETLRDLLDTMPTYRGEARGPLLAVADEALRLVGSKAAVPSVHKVVAELIDRTIGLLPLVRTSQWKLEALVALCRTLAADGVDGADVERLFRQVLAFIETIDDPVFKAVCLANLAGVVTPGTRAGAERALQDAERMGEAFTSADRLHVHASGLGAHRKLWPGKAYTLLAKDLRNASQPAAGSLTAFPLDELLKILEPIGDERDALVSLANVLIANGTARSGLPVALCRSGCRDLAWQAVDIGIGKDFEAEYVVRTIHAMLPVLDADGRPEAARRLLERYGAGHVSAPLAEAFATLGHWTECLACLDQLQPEGRGLVAVACLEQALALPHNAEREQLVDQFLGRCHHGAPDKAPAILLSGAALALARADHFRAKSVMSRATTTGLSQLPEGDNDSLRLVTSVALASAGEIEEARHVALACKWAHQRIASLLAAVRAAPPKVEFQRRVSQDIAEILLGADDRSEKVFNQACTAVRYFAAMLPDEARTILERSEARLPPERFSVGWAECRLATLEARVSLDPPAGAEVALKAMAVLLAQDNFSRELFMQAGQLVIGAVESHERAGLLGSLRRIADKAATPKDRVRLWSAFAAILAKFDGPAAYSILRDQIHALDQAAMERDDSVSLGAGAARVLARLLNELTGGSAHRAPGVVAVQHVVASIAYVAEWLEPRLVEQLLGQAWTWIGTTPSLNAGSRAAAAKGFLKSLAELPATPNALGAGLADQSARDLVRLFGSGQADVILGEAVFDLASAGRKVIAEALLGQITDPERMDRGKSQISLFHAYHSIPDRTPTEEALFVEAKEKGIAAVVVRNTRSGNTQDMILGLLDYLRENHPRYQIIDRTLYLVPPVVSQWGVDAARAIVDAMKDFDGRLLAAAGKVSQL